MHWPYATWRFTGEKRSTLECFVGTEVAVGYVQIKDARGLLFEDSNRFIQHERSFAILVVLTTRLVYNSLKL